MFPRSPSSRWIGSRSNPKLNKPTRFSFSRASDPDDDEEVHGPKHTSRSAASFFTDANNLPGNTPSSLTRIVATRVDAATRQPTEPNHPVQSDGDRRRNRWAGPVEVSEVHKFSKPEHQGHDFTINHLARQENDKWVCNHKCKDKKMQTESTSSCWYLGLMRA